MLPLSSSIGTTHTQQIQLSNVGTTVPLSHSTTGSTHKSSSHLSSSSSSPVLPQSTFFPSSQFIKTEDIPDSDSDDECFDEIMMETSQTSMCLDVKVVLSTNDLALMILTSTESVEFRSWQSRVTDTLSGKSLVHTIKHPMKTQYKMYKEALKRYAKHFEKVKDKQYMQSPTWIKEEAKTLISTHNKLVYSALKQCTEKCPATELLLKNIVTEAALNTGSKTLVIGNAYTLWTLLADEFNKVSTTGLILSLTQLFQFKYGYLDATSTIQSHLNTIDERIIHNGGFHPTANGGIPDVIKMAMVICSLPSQLTQLKEAFLFDTRDSPTFEYRELLRRIDAHNHLH